MIQKAHHRLAGLGIGLSLCLCSPLLYAMPLPAASQAHTGIEHLAFSQNSKQLLYISNRKPRQGANTASPLIHTINVHSGTLTKHTQLMLNPNTHKIMGFTPDGFKLAVLSNHGLGILHNQTGRTLRTLNVPLLTRAATHYHPLTPITNASGTQQLFYIKAKHQLNVIHTGNGRTLATLSLPASPLLNMGISADGRQVAYQVASNAQKSSLYLDDIYQKRTITRLDLTATVPHLNHTPITFSQNGKYLFAAPDLVTLNTNTRTTLPPPVRPAPVIFSAHSRFLLIPHAHNQLLRYDLQSQQKQPISLNLPTHCIPSGAYDISPNRTWLAIGARCEQGREASDVISLLNAKTGAFVRNLRPHVAP